jgi:hypothetical protein
MMLAARRSFVLALAACCLVPGNMAAQVQGNIDMSADNLMVVLRESYGSNKQDETLVPLGNLRVRLRDGREVDIQLAAF